MLTDEEFDEARQKLAAGRVLATRYMPYFSKALLAMSPHPRPGFGTFAVDERWRMYYDPIKCLEWTVPEIAAVWLHEVGHLVRSHAHRFKNLEGFNNDPALFNQAGDAAINSDLKDSDILLPNPEVRVYADGHPHFPTWKKGMTAEEMYYIARGEGKGDPNDDSGAGQPDDKSESGGQEDTDNENQNGDSESADNESAEPGQPGEGESEEKSEDENETSEGGDSSNDSEDDDESGSSGEPTDDESDESGDSSSDESSNPSSADEGGDESGEGDGDSSDQESGQGASASDDNQDKGDQSSSDSVQEGSSPDDATDQNSAGSPDDSARQHDCGSAVDGIPRDYEEHDDDDGSIDQVTAENLKKKTAEDILNYDKSHPGTVPGSLVREAKNILEPQIDWRDEFSALVRQLSAKHAGTGNYSYLRPSRRSAGSVFIMPSMRQPPAPEIIVVLDTSGSMDETRELSAALAEMEEIVNRSARFSESQSIRIINCDSKDNVIEVVRDLRDFEIVGGGGTDMRVGIKAAAEARPKAHIVLVITDGGTPWPQQIPEENQQAVYVAVIVGDRDRKASKHVPDWMKTIIVHIPDKRRRR